MSSAQRKYPIPDGFTWNIEKNIYVSKIGYSFNSETGETLSDNGLVVADASSVPAVQSGAHSKQSDATLSKPDTLLKQSDTPNAIPTSTQPINVAAVDMVASRVSALLTFIDSLGASRELSIARTKIDEAMMWIERHVKSVKP